MSDLESNTLAPPKGEGVSAAPSIADDKTIAAAAEKEKKSSDRPSTGGSEKEKEKNETDVEAAPVNEEGEDESRYLSGMKLFTVFLGFMCAILLVALDQTIVATALPKIVSEFNALSDITWIISAYFLTQAGLMLTFAQFLTLAPTKWLFLGAIFIFELGSLVCGVANSVNVLIFGRAFAGVGASGIFISVLSIIAEVTRLEQRPVLFGAFGAVFAFSSVVGPLLGGAFADYVTWRWAFYINLPLGGLSLIVVFVFLKASPPIDPVHRNDSFLAKMAAVDWLGTLLCLAAVTTFLLPLQWGGNQYEWNDKIVIAMFCVFAVIGPLFVAWEWYMGPKALMPVSLFRNMTQIGCVLESFMMMLCMLTAIYYLPFFYQATRGRSATESGIDILPFMLAIIISSGISGGIISKTGRYWWFLVIGPLISSIGAGLLFTIKADTDNAKLIGYQILFGAGLGAALQNVIIAIQTAYHDKPKMIPQATSLVSFFQLVGGVIGIAIAGTIFANQFRSGLATYAPDLPPELAVLVRQSVTVIKMLDDKHKAGVVEAYVNALNYVFVLAIPAGILGAAAGAIFIEDLDLKEITAKTGGVAAPAHM
jgi:EmrB/QacA subfamily drug resistance transporter